MEFPELTRCLQYVDCRICAGEEHETFLKARGYRIVRCRSCGLWFVNPQPTLEELAQFYARYDDGEVWRSGEDSFNREIRKVILRFKRQGAVLDVGCGSGKFLDCMREVGLTVTGIEPSQSATEYAEPSGRPEIFKGTVEEYVLKNVGRKFDVVTLLNVLEHIRDPRKMLLKLRELMAPDALLAVVVPDARFHALVGGARRLLNVSDPYWLEKQKGVLSGFKLPDHLSSFAPGTISLLLQRCGFPIVAVRNAPVVWNEHLHRNTAKLLMRSIFGALHYLTVGRFLFGYSTLVVARIQPVSTA